MSTEPINTSLEKQIAAALVNDTASVDLVTLINATETAIHEAEATVEVTRAAALDPLLSSDPKVAREAMEAARFASDRLRTMLPRLQNRLREVQAEEELARWLPRQQAVAARRDELAAKLRDLYLPFVEAIVPLLVEIEDADQEIQLINHAAPHKAVHAGGYLLESVEHAARGPSALQLRHLQILKDLRLPNWEGAELPLWPPHRPIIPGIPTFILGGDARLNTGDWGAVFTEQQRAAERAAREDAERETKALLAANGRPR